MKPKELGEFLQRYFSMNPLDVPRLMIWGHPGIGKTDIVRHSALKVFSNSVVHLKLKGIDYSKLVKTLYLLLYDPTDIKGYPTLKEDSTVWLPPSFLPKKGRDLDKGVIFLDELPSAPSLVQVSAHRLVLERQIEDYKLPDGWFVVSAGNYIGESATHKMYPALCNRFIHVNLEADLEDWKIWAYANDVRTEVISFLNWKPSLLLDMNTAKVSRAFPTPRTWKMVSDILNLHLETSLTLEVIQGAVGEGAGREFIAYLKLYKDLPDANKVLKENIVPQEPSQLFAVIGGIVEIYKRKPRELATKVLLYSYKLPKDFAVVLVKDCIKIHDAVSEVEEWNNWRKEFKQLIL